MAAMLLFLFLIASAIVFVIVVMAQKAANAGKPDEDVRRPRKNTPVHRH